VAFSTRNSIVCGWLQRWPLRANLLIICTNQIFYICLAIGFPVASGMSNFTHSSTIFLRSKNVLHPYTTTAYTHNRTCDKLSKLDRSNHGSPIKISK
jgi:hypothetical protein